MVCAAVSAAAGLLVPNLTENQALRLLRAEFGPQLRVSSTAAPRCHSLFIELGFPLLSSDVQH